MSRTVNFKKKINFNEKGGIFSPKKYDFIGNFITEIKVSDPSADIKREIAIMKKLNHPNVIKLYEVIQDPEKDKLYMSIFH